MVVAGEDMSEQWLGIPSGYAKAPALMAFVAVDCTKFPQRRLSCKSATRNLAMVSLNPFTAMMPFENDQ